VTAYTDHVLRLHERDAKTFRLLAQPPRKLAAGDTLRKTGHVVELFGRCGLSTKGGPLDHRRVDALARRIQRGCQTGRSATDNNEREVFAFDTCLQAQFRGQFGIARLDQNRTIAKDNRRDDSFAVVLLDDQTFRRRLLFNIYPSVGDLKLAEKLLGTVAIGTPVSPFRAR
jgi:hypothetical protein